MNLSMLDLALWLASFAGHVVLLWVLIVKRRWMTFPVFTALIGFTTLRTVLLYLMYRHGDSDAYTVIYAGADIVDLALQIALVFEMARIVLKPAGTWVRDAYTLFLAGGATGAIIAAGLAFAVGPHRPADMEGWLTKGHLFAILLLSELFAAMMFASSRLGLVWRNHVMGLGQGLTLWAVVSLMIETFHSYYGPDWHADSLEHARMVSYLIAISYWIITFWPQEPGRRTLSQEMQDYLSTQRKKQ